MKIFGYIGLMTIAIAGRLCAQTNAPTTTNTVVNTNAVNQILALVTTNPPAVKPPLRETVIEADGPADFRQVNHGLQVIYRDHVRVDSPSLKLRCEWLAADLSQTGHPTNIVAETNVVIDATDVKGEPIHATGDKAVYVYNVLDGSTNETLTLTNNVGNATAEYKGVTIKGNPITVDLIRQAIGYSNGETIIRGDLIGKVAGTNSPIGPGSTVVQTNLQIMETNLPATDQTTAPK